MNISPLRVAAVVLTLVAPLIAADAPKGKFPAAQVDQIMQGWAGTNWGTTVAAFQKKYPAAKQLPSGRWITGGEPDLLGGVKVTSEYGFNKKGELYLVRLEPVAADDRKDLKEKLAAAGVLRDMGNGNWKNGSVSFVVASVNKEQFAMAVDAKFVDPKEAK